MCRQDSAIVYFVNWTDCPPHTVGIMCEYDCHCWSCPRREILQCSFGCRPGWLGNNCQQSKAIIFDYGTLILSHLSTK